MTRAPEPAPAAPSARPTVAIVDDPHGVLDVATTEVRVASTPVPVTDLSAAETAALIARMEPLPDLSAQNAVAPTIRPASLPPPRSGYVQPIAFAAPAGKPVGDAPAAPAVTALAPPTILPTGEVEAESEIRVRFDEPMVAVAAVGTRAALPITFAPAIAGSWKWIDTRVAAFVATGVRFPAATEVTVTVPAGIKALSGATLAAPVTSTFATSPLDIARVWPKTIRPDSPIAISFDQAIDPAKVLPFLSVIGPRNAPLAARPIGLAEARTLWAKSPNLEVTDALITQLGKHVVFLAPRTAWPAGIHAQVKLAKRAPSDEGPRTRDQDRFATFDIVPPFSALGIRCNDGAVKRAPICPANSWMEVVFATPISEPSYRAEKVQFEDEPFEDNKPEGAEVPMIAPKRPGVAFRVAIGEGITDIYGQAFTGARSLGFTTTLERFDPQLAARSGMYVLDPRFEIPQWRLDVQAVSSVRVQLFQVQPRDAFAYEQLEENPRLQPPGKRILDKTYTVGPRMGTEIRVDLRPALAAGGTGHVIALATVVPASAPVPEWFQRRALAWIQVSRLGVSARIDGDKLSAWTTDISPDHFLAPIANATTQLLISDRPAPVVTATSDATGHAELALPAARPTPPPGVKAPPEPSALLLVQSGTDSTLTQVSPFEHAIRSEHALWYVADDRFTYKPGETAYVKGWIRWTDSGSNPDLALPRPGETVAYALRDGRGNVLASGDAPLTDQGGFDMELKLPATANLGQAMLSLSSRGNGTSHWFAIQEFRTPAYAVTLDDDVGHSGAIPLLLGESIEMNAVAKYYAGGGLGGADIKWDAKLSTARFQPAGWDLFHFDPIRKRSVRSFWGDSYDDPVPVFVTKPGSLSGTSAATTVWSVGALPLGRTSVLEVDATVTDVDRQTIRASSRPILVHPASYYVGIRQKPRAEEVLEVIVTDIDGKPVAGVPVTVELEGVLGSELRRDDARVTDTQRCALTSAATPVECPWHRVDLKTAYTATAHVTDPRGRVNVAQFDIPWWNYDDRNDLTLVPDRMHYRPGDVAKLEIRSKTVPATAVVSFARQGMIAQKRIELTKASTTVELPIEPAFVPNVYVLVDRIAKRRTMQPGSTLPLPEEVSTGADLKVDLDAARLVMTARPLTPLVEPGDDASFEVTVAHDDKPLAGAEVALIVVDEAVLALSGGKHGDPLEPFYHVLSHGTSGAGTYAMVEDAGPELAGKPGVRRYKLDELGIIGRGSGTGSGYGVGGGRGGMRGRDMTSVVSSRKDFRATAVFSPKLHTDAAGKVRVTVKMPDSLTRYRVVALATANTRWFGKAEGVIVAQRKINARTQAPRFLTQGDRFSLPVVVQNLDAAPRTVDVAVRAANLAQTGPAGKRVTVPGGQRAEVRFDFATQARGTAAIQTIATSGSFADASTVQVPVYVPATTESFATYGTVDDGAKFEQLAVPADIFPDVGDVQVELASTQLQSLVDAFWYVYAYPFECAEQRSARMLATAYVLDVLDAFWALGRATKQEITDQLAQDVKRLVRDQRPDGGWGYFPGMKTDPFVTMQVLSALATRNLGGDPMAKAIAFVTKEADTRLARLAKSAAQPASARLDRAELPAVVSLAAAALTSLASAKVDVRARTERLHAAAVALDAYPVDAKARVLALLAGDARDKPIRARLAAELLAQVHETAAGATVTTTYAEAEKLLLVSEPKTTALVLDALIREQPQQPLVTKLARGLLDGRKGGRWHSTQENLAVIKALRRYFDVYEKDTPSFTGKLWFGDAAYAEESFLGRSTKRALARVDWPTLQPGTTKDLAIVKAGTGRMYYRIGITYAPKQTDLPALDAGFVVRRSYTAVDDPSDVQHLPDGRWKIKLGARVLVRVEALNTTLRDAVAIVDPLPAGLEPVNTKLATSERAAEGSNSRGWDFENMRDNRAEVFAMHLREGSHEMTYTARATTPGIFIAAPAKAEEMYNPETFGRSSGTTVVIE